MQFADLDSSTQMLIGAGAVVVIALAGIAMLNPGQTPTGDAASEDLETLRIGQVPAPASEPYYTMIDEGFLREEGFEAEIYDFGGPGIPNALERGTIDIGSSATTVSVYQMQGGTNLRAVAQRYGAEQGQDNEFMVVRDGIEINSTEDFEGLTLCTESAGSMDDLFMKRWAEKNGIDLQEDVDYIYTSEESWQTAFASGSVDACVLNDPGATLLENEGLAYKYESLSRPDFWTTFVAVHERMIEEEPEKLRAFLRAYARAAAYARQNPNESLENMAEYTGYDVSTLREADLGEVRQDLRVNMTLLNEVHDTMYQYGLIEERYDMSTYVDNSFIAEIQQDVEGVGPES